MPPEIAILAKVMMVVTDFIDQDFSLLVDKVEASSRRPEALSLPISARLIFSD